jgi:hypothetical protein
MQFLLVILLALCTLACSSHRKMSSAERKSVAEKEYQNLTKDQLIDGAKKVLTLMDKNDVTFEPIEDGFIARRSWFLYKVVHASNGTDFWKFQVKQTEQGLVAMVKPSRRYGLVESKEKGEAFQGTAVYDLFWGRLNYTVGQANNWPSCEDGLKKNEENKTWGSLEQICDSITLADERPSADDQQRLPATAFKAK